MPFRSFVTLKLISKPSGTLASRTDTGISRDAKLVGASFMTLEGLLRFSGTYAALSQTASSVITGNNAATRTLSKTQSFLDSTPHKGKTAMLFTSSVTSGDGMVARSHFEVPRGVIEDAIILGASSAATLAQP